MKKRFLSLLLLPLMLIGCTNNNPNSDKGSYEHNSISKAVHTGEIGDFKLTGPENGFITDTGFTFTWEEANNWGKEHIRKKHGSNKHKWYKIKAD